MHAYIHTWIFGYIFNIFHEREWAWIVCSRFQFILYSRVLLWMVLGYHSTSLCRLIRENKHTNICGCCFMVTYSKNYNQVYNSFLSLMSLLCHRELLEEVNLKVTLLKCGHLVAFRNHRKSHHGKHCRQGPQACLFRSQCIFLLVKISSLVLFCFHFMFLTSFSSRKFRSHCSSRFILFSFIVLLVLCTST